MAEEDINKETVLKDHTAVLDQDLHPTQADQEVYRLDQTEEDTKRAITEEIKEEVEAEAIVIAAEIQEVQALEVVLQSLKEREETQNLHLVPGQDLNLSQSQKNKSLSREPHQIRSLQQKL